MDAEAVQRLREAAEPVFQRHPVALAYLYGSQSCGTATPSSDFDVAVVTDGDLAGRERLRLELTLEMELAAAVGGGEFDVRVINRAPLAVKGTVVQTGRLLFAKDEVTRVEFQATALDRYLDFLPVLLFHRRAYLAAQRTALQERGLL